MDVLILNPGTVKKEFKAEHLGIASLKTYLLAQKFDADILDTAIEDLTVEDTVDRILSLNPVLLGVSMIDATKNKGLAIIKQIRNEGYRGKIVVGGYFATFASHELLRDFSGIDFVVRGEGELTLAELAEKIIRNNNINYGEIHGLSFRESGRIIENPARKLIEDLDILPPVDRKYTRDVSPDSSGIRIYASRGCWGQCAFCDIINFYKTSPGRKWRRRSATHLVDEIQNLIEEFGENYFIFNDDQFLSKGQSAYNYVSDLSDELERRNINIKFELMCRADAIDKRTMLLLKSIGLQRVFLGIESFNKAQLQRFNKKISVFRNLKSLITLYKLKIDVITAVILADAYTTLTELLEHFYLLYQLRKRYFNSDYCRISVNKQIEVYRGSMLYRQYKTEHLLKTDNYMDGCNYRLRFWTNLRLKLLDFEEKLGKIFS